ncbi:MAG: hypothetical protein WA942_18480 [Mycolicibacter sinensis]
MKAEEKISVPAVMKDKTHNHGAPWLWRIVDDLTGELMAPDCHTIYTAIASGVANGWRPTRAEIVNLVEFGRQQAVAAQHSPSVRKIAPRSAG